MEIQKIQQYKSAFDLIAKNIKDDEGNTIEVWYARELQQVLGYSRWENFAVAIGQGGLSYSVEYFHYEYEPTFVIPLWSNLSNWYNMNHRYLRRTFAQILLLNSVDASTHLSNNTHSLRKYNTPSTLACHNVSRSGHTGNQQIGQVLLYSHSQQATLPLLLFP